MQRSIAANDLFIVSSRLFHKSMPRVDTRLLIGEICLFYPSVYTRRGRKERPRRRRMRAFIFCPRERNPFRRDGESFRSSSKETSSARARARKKDISRKRLMIFFSPARCGFPSETPRNVFCRYARASKLYLYYASDLYLSV